MSHWRCRGWTARCLAAALGLAGAAGARGASLSVEEGTVVLGRTESTAVLIQVDERAGTEELPLRLAVNVGRFSEPVRLGPGRYRAVYVPPPTRFPQVALVAVWRETGPDAPIDFLRIPLVGVARVPVAARPAAAVKVRVDRETFGPVTADRLGRAEVPVAVPPGVRLCDVTVKERNGPEVTKQVPVEVPPYNRLTAALVPHAVVADGRSEVRVDVFYDLGGADVPPDRIRVAPSTGAVTFQRASRGLYTYRYVPPAGTAAASVSFAISVAGDPAASSTARLSLGLPPPTRLVVTPPPRPLRAGSGASAPIKVLALDAAGMGLPGLEVHATANGEPLPPAAPRGGGQYEIPFTAPAVYPPGGLVEIQAVASHAEGATFGRVNWQLEPAAAPRSVTPRLSPSPVPADGRTEALLLLDLRDEAGMPVEHAQLISVASHGALGKVRERGGGIYEQTYRAPEELPGGDDAVVRVMDGSGRFERSFPIPLRLDPRRLLLGPTAGYTLSPGAASGPRAGAELWVPFRVGDARLGAGAAVGVGTASRTVSDASLALRSVTDATFVPAALKLGYELHAGRRLSVTGGAGAVATWARFRSSLASGTQQGVALGWMAFLDLGWAFGPGLGVLGVSYGSAAVSTADYRIDPGGLSLAVGYRLGLL